MLDVPEARPEVYLEWCRKLQDEVIQTCDGGNFSSANSDGFWLFFVSLSRFLIRDIDFLSGHRAGSSQVPMTLSSEDAKKVIAKEFTWHCRWIRLKVLRST